MPELPEVETIVRDLAPAVEGQTLTNPRLLKSDVLRGVTKRRLLGALRDNTLRTLRRRAKHIVALLGSGERLVIQPRMTGSLILYERRLTAEERRYAVLRVTVGDVGELVYRDVRRLGTIHLLDEAGWAAYTERIGPEPLEETFDLAAFRTCLGGTRQAIKKAIMDQHRIAGIGNIYANEALFRARIDPSRRTDRLGAAETRRLYRTVRDVLQAAIDARGSTIRDYRTGTGGQGGFQHRHQVYDRKGEPCFRCKSTLITTHAIDGRQSTYCPSCQE